MSAKSAKRPSVGHREVFYNGRVQGVGFRYTARQIATRFSVTGFVQNLADGRVRLVAEGEPDEVERFLDAVAGELGRYIAAVEHRDKPATGEYSEFGIRH